MKKRIKYRFTISLSLGGEENETLATPPVTIPFYGQTEAFRVTKINVYQGEDGEEMLIKQIALNDEASNH